MAATTTAFMHALTDGFLISGVVLLFAVPIALTLIPSRMRTAQTAFEWCGVQQGPPCHGMVAGI